MVALRAPSLPPGAIPRSSRDGPARTRRACSELASSVARGGPPAAACCALTYMSACGISVAVLQLGGRSLCLVRLPRAWAHANRKRHARAQHAEAARLAAAPAAPRMHAAHARRTQARGSSEAGWWISASRTRRRVARERRAHVAAELVVVVVVVQRGAPRCTCEKQRGVEKQKKTKESERRTSKFYRMRGE